MKLASIDGLTPNNNNKYKNNTLAFKGVTEGLINFWQFVDNGGRALQFTVEDMTGTNIPRSIKGLLAGKKYTGHVNIPAFLQEAIREFLTGPTMCITPWVVLTLAKKHAGESANTHVENIENLSYLLGKTEVAAGQDIEEAFYNTVVKDMLNSTTGKEVADDKLKEMTALFKKFGNETDKKSKKTILAQMQTLFENIVKSTKDNYKGEDFLTAKYSKNAAEIGATKFKNYAGYTTSFIKDFKKSGLSLDKLEEFKTTWVGKRLFIIAGMIFITGTLMSQIPKLYTMASGKINPNATAIYNEADKNKNKQANTANNSENEPAKAQETKTEEKPNKKGKLAFGAALAAAAIGVGATLLKGKQKPEVITSNLQKLQEVVNETCEKLGSTIGDKDITKKVLKYIEPTGANNSFLTLVGLMVGTVITPRIITAAKRNPDNKEATKDEMKEILFRDIQTVVILLMMLKSVNAVFTGIAAKQNGIPMTTKPFTEIFDKSLKTFGDKARDFAKAPLDKFKRVGQNVLDVLNPLGGIRALTNEEFNAKYSNFTFDELPKILEQVKSEKGSDVKVFNKIIDGTIKRCQNMLDGNPKKGILGIAEKLKLTANKEGKEVQTLVESKENLEATIKALEKLKAEGIGSIANVENKAVQNAITSYLQDENNSLTKSGKAVNSYLRFGAWAFEVGYLGLGLPALNQKRLEKKYLKANGGKKVDTDSTNENANASLVNRNIKPEKVKLYHSFIK